MASQVTRKRTNKNPQLFRREKCSSASSSGNGLRRLAPKLMWVLRVSRRCHLGGECAKCLPSDKADVAMVKEHVEITCERRHDGHSWRLSRAAHVDATQQQDAPQLVLHPPSTQHDYVNWLITASYDRRVHSWASRLKQTLNQGPSARTSPYSPGGARCGSRMLGASAAMVPPPGVPADKVVRPMLTGNRLLRTTNPYFRPFPRRMCSWKCTL